MQPGDHDVQRLIDDSHADVHCSPSPCTGSRLANTGRVSGEDRTLEGLGPQVGVLTVPEDRGGQCLLDGHSSCHARTLGLQTRQMFSRTWLRSRTSPLHPGTCDQLPTTMSLTEQAVSLQVHMCVRSNHRQRYCQATPSLLVDGGFWLRCQVRLLLCILLCSGYISDLSARLSLISPSLLIHSFITLILIPPPMLQQSSCMLHLHIFVCPFMSHAELLAAVCCMGEASGVSHHSAPASLADVACTAIDGLTGQAGSCFLVVLPLIVLGSVQPCMEAAATGVGTEQGFGGPATG